MIGHDERLKRELSVCQMIANGMTRIEVGEAIGRTRMTVDHILTELKRRHNTPSEAALIAKLMREGWIR